MCECVLYCWGVGGLQYPGIVEGNVRGEVDEDDAIDGVGEYKGVHLWRVHN